MLKHGQWVRIKVKNGMYPYRDRYAPGVSSVSNEFNFYEGEVRFEKWFKPNEVGLTTDQPHFPMRVVRMERIVEIDGVERSESSAQSLQAGGDGEILKRTVRGSTGTLYEVEVGRSGRSSCTCPGHQFRGNCRHVKELGEAFAA